MTTLPEWKAFIAAHEAATAITTPQPGEQPEGASAARTALIHAAHKLARAAAAPSPATEPEPPMWSGSSPIDAMTPGWGQESDPCYLGGWRCSVCPVCPYNPAFTEAERNAAIAARTPPPPAAPAVSPEPGHDGHTHDVGPVKVWRCGGLSAMTGPECTPDGPHNGGRCGWVDAVPSPEPERDEPLNAYEDTDGPSGEDAVRERQYERDHGVEP